MLQIITTAEELQSFIDASIEASFNKLSSFPIALQPQIVTGTTVRERLDISEPTLIRWRQKGKIPYMKIGSAVRYDWLKVVAALEVKRRREQDDQ